MTSTTQNTAGAPADRGIGNAMKSAREYQQAGQLQAAASLYRQVLSLEPENVEAISSLGIVCRHLGRNDLAIAFAGRAVQLRPMSLAFWHNYGEAWMAIGEAQQAILAFTEANEIDVNRPEPLAGIGVALNRLGLWQESIEALRKSIELGLRQPGIFVDLAKSLMRCDRLDEAEAALGCAEEIKPDLVELWQVRGEVLGHRKQYSQAVAAFARASTLAPGYPRPHHGQGVVLALNGEFEAAAEAMRRALALDPAYPEANCGLGAILLRLNKPLEAIRCYEKAIADKPSYLEARADLALAYEKVGRLKDAAVQYDALAQVTADEAFFKFQRASMGQGEAPPTAPPTMVARLFDNYARNFDEHLTKFLGYRAPQLIFQAVGRASPPERMDILDLGCGTGLCGQLFKPMASTLSGIDLSSAMIEQARQRGIYSRLVVGDLLESTAATAGLFDLVTACDVFCYLGDLSPIFQKVAGVLKPGGLFAFTVEAIDEGDYTLRQTRRYAHSPIYIRQLAERHGYTLVSLDRTALRTEAQKDVDGLVVVLRR